jgi:hypothetical protein
LTSFVQALFNIPYRIKPEVITDAARKSFLYTPEKQRRLGVFN